MNSPVRKQRTRPYNDIPNVRDLVAVSLKAISKLPRGETLAQEVMKTVVEKRAKGQPPQSFPSEKAPSGQGAGRDELPPGAF